MNVNVPPHGLRTATDTSRVDLVLIADMVTPGARVLDIGCGDGTLMRLLASKRGADARGIELSQAGVNNCVAQGLAVIQGDADADLVYYPDLAFDYAILEPDHSGDLLAAARARAAVAHRQEGDRVFPQFRALARAYAAYVPRQDAEDPQSAGPMV